MDLYVPTHHNGWSDGRPTNISIKTFLTQNKGDTNRQKSVHTPGGHSIMPCLLTLTSRRPGLCCLKCREWGRLWYVKKNVRVMESERERERRPANSCKHFRVCLVLFLFRQRNWTSDYEVDTHCESNKVCGDGPRRAIWMVRVMFFVRSTTVQKWQMYVNFIATETNGKHYLIL